MNGVDYSRQSDDYHRIEKAIHFIENNFRSQPSLQQIADSVYLSQFHFTRLFKRWAGISPIQFLQFTTLAYTKQKLAASKNLLDASLDAGLSGPGRLHDLFVTFEAMTPGEFKNQGAGLKITYGFNSSPFGDCLLARTDRGICHLGFVKAGNRSEALDSLVNAWPKARFIENSHSIVSLVNDIFTLHQKRKPKPFHLHLKGTNFQINVWKALLNIPEGRIVSYQDVAEYMGRPAAFRAVANAVAANPVAFLIPCHRVIAKSGRVHQYQWGSARKKALIAWEAARSA